MPPSTHWTCCRCKQTWSYAIYAACIDCHHRRCSHCTPGGGSWRPRAGPKPRSSHPEASTATAPQDCSNISQTTPKPSSSPPKVPTVRASEGRSNVSQTTPKPRSSPLKVPTVRASEGRSNVSQASPRPSLEGVQILPDPPKDEAISDHMGSETVRVKEHPEEEKAAVQTKISSVNPRGLRPLYRQLRWLGLSAAARARDGLRNQIRRLPRMFEPRLQPEMTRIRWSCACGDQLWDDYRLQNPGQESSIQRDLDELFCNVPHQDANGNSSRARRGSVSWFGAELVQWIHGMWQRVVTLTVGRELSPDLEEQPEGIGIALNRRPIKWFLTCLTFVSGHTLVTQKKGSSILSDHCYFSMLRSLYRPYQAWWLKWLPSLRTVVGIEYVEVSQILECT